MQGLPGQPVQVSETLWCCLHSANSTAKSRTNLCGLAGCRVIMLRYVEFFGGEDQQRAIHECTSPVMMPWCSETLFFAKRVGLLVPAVSQLAVIQTATCRSVDRHPSSVQPAEAGVVSEKCLCVFDIDRTLTSKQGMQDLLLTMSYHMSHDMVFLICRYMQICKSI